MASGSMGRFAGYKYGPAIAVSAKHAMIANPKARPGVRTRVRQRARARGRGSVTTTGSAPPYPGVDDPVEQVGRDVGQDHGRRDDQERAGHQRVVALAYAVEEHGPEPRVIEDVLDE